MFLHLSVILSTGGHAWLLWGGTCVVAQVGCVVAPGGMHGCSGEGGMHGCSGEGACMVAPWLACVVAPGGCAWFLLGRVRGFSGGACVGYDEIRSMSGRYASYWNAFLYTFIHFISYIWQLSFIIIYFLQNKLFIFRRYGIMQEKDGWFRVLRTFNKGHFRRHANTLQTKITSSVVGECHWSWSII